MKKIIISLLFLLTLTSCSSSYSFELEESVDTIEVYSEYEVKGCTLVLKKDSFEMDLVENNLDTNTIGQYILTYEKVVKDELYTCQRMVFVTDQTAPIVTLNIGIDHVKINSTWTDSGVTVTDNYDQNPTIQVHSNVLLDTVGIYEVEYVVTDESNNQTIITRTVSVFE